MYKYDSVTSKDLFSLIGMTQKRDCPQNGISLLTHTTLSMTTASSTDGFIRFLHFFFFKRSQYSYSYSLSLCCTRVPLSNARRLLHIHPVLLTSHQLGPYTKKANTVRSTIANTYPHHILAFNYFLQLQRPSSYSVRIQKRLCAKTQLSKHHANTTVVPPAQNSRAVRFGASLGGMVGR